MKCRLIFFSENSKLDRMLSVINLLSILMIRKENPVYLELFSNATVSLIIRNDRFYKTQHATDNKGGNINCTFKKNSQTL